MMIMRRREGEKILIGSDIVIHIAQIGRSRVKIAIEAPRAISIVAEEVQRVADENTRAAEIGRESVAALLANFQPRVV